MRKITASLVAVLAVAGAVVTSAGPAAADKPRLGIHGTQGRCHNLTGIDAPGGQHGSYVIYQLVDRCLRIRP